MSNNPHADREAALARHFQATDSLTGQPIEPLDVDGIYDTPEYQQSIPCGICDRPTFKKASVGTFVCECGAIYAGGSWFRREDGTPVKTDEIYLGWATYSDDIGPNIGQLGLEPRTEFTLPPRPPNHEPPHHRSKGNPDAD